MKINEILSESVKSDSAKNYKIEILDHTSHSADVLFDFGNDASILLNVEFEIDAREVDAGFGYEYGSISGYHDASDVEGEGIVITDVSIDTENYGKDAGGRYWNKKIAQALRVPGRDSLNPDVVFKYFVKALGGKSSVVAKISDAIEEQIGDELISQHLKAVRDDY